VAFCIFDVLVAGGRDVMTEPLASRKHRLSKLFPTKMDQILVLSSLEPNGEWLFDMALQLELEGVVAKRLDSPYQPGARSLDWLKIKRPGSMPAELFRR
jgi:bifunctional non-homologous end joining protein LigD